MCANFTLICYHRLLFLLASLLARVKKYAPQITVRHFCEVWGVLHSCFVVLEKNNTISHLVKTRCYSIFVVLIAALLWQTFRFEDISGLCACYAKLFIYDKIDLKLICVLCISVVGLVIVESKKFQYLITEIKGFTTKEVIHEVAILTTMLLLLFIFGSDISSQFFYFKY